VWFTPNYYVQQLFGKYLGTKLVGTSFSSYKKGKVTELTPRGGIEIAAGNAEDHVKYVKVIDNKTEEILLEQDFMKELNPTWEVSPGTDRYRLDAEKGLVIQPQNGGRNGLYITNDSWSDYKVEVNASKVSGNDGFYVGVGLTDIS